MSAGHSILPPSGAEVWQHCPMWVTMNRDYPQEDTPDTLGGNAAHWAGWQMLAGEPVLEGMKSPNGVFVTDEMIDGAKLLVDVIRTRMPVREQWHVEEPVAIPRIHPQCWGTPDIWAYSDMTLEVVEYKFGHAFVDEYANAQGVCYIAGILNSMSGLQDQVVKVNFTIVQPRCYHKGAPVRTWSVKASDLRAQINQLSTAAHAALEPDPLAVTNPGCDNCPGRHVCPALQKAAYHDAEMAVRSSPVALPPTAASLELRMLERSLERLQARVTGMREAVANYIRQGHAVPYHRVEQTYGRRQWTIPTEQVISIGGLFQFDLAKPGVVTPTQAIKLGIPECLVDGLSSRQPGSTKLVPTDPSDAARVFGTTY